MEDSFCHYNMFNHHFFDGKVRITTVILVTVEEQVPEYLVSYFLESLKIKSWLLHHLLIGYFPASSTECVSSI